MLIERLLSPTMTKGRIVPKPRWLEGAEATIGARIPLHPHAISAIKLALALPIILSVLGLLPTLAPALVVTLFALFAALDALDGVVARAQGKETTFGRIFDRLTDWPLLIALAMSCCGPLPTLPVALKLGLDLALLLLFCLGRGPVENRIRTTLSYAVLLTLLFISQGWLPGLVTPAVALAVLWTNVAFNALIVLVRLDLFHRRKIADGLSAGNLLCGLVSIAAALAGLLHISLTCLILGALLDGLDGAAARRWGGTRLGVYSDDVADGVNYGLAPGVAIGCTLGGPTGWLLGAVFAVFTIGRLVYFTLNKGESDPRYFAGMPSTVGGLLVLTGLIALGDNLALVGAAVGAACTLMVAFGLRYRHLGRLVAGRPRLLALVALALGALLTGGLLLGPEVPAVFVLTLALGYGLSPAVRAMSLALRRSPRPADLPAQGAAALER